MSKATTPTNNPATAPKKRVPGRSQRHIDYGPAIVALDDLIAWAFELARKDVAGWREGTRRVRVAHRYIRALVRGKRPRVEPREDVMFTAALLVRLFDADLGLGAEEMARMLERLGLPLDHVPAAAPAALARPPMAPSVWHHLRAIYSELTPSERTLVRSEAAELTDAARDGWIAALMDHTVEQGADYVRAYLRDQVEAPPPAAPLPTMPRVVVRAPLSTVRPLVRPAVCDGCPLSPLRRAA